MFMWVLQQKMRGFAMKNSIYLILLATAIFIAAPGLINASEEAAAMSSDAAELAERLGEGALFTFLGIFIIGLALNLTPCVYPMLAVTVSIFGGQQQQKNIFTVFIRALLYVLGIATMYSILGVFAALTGGLFGGILQSRAVLISIAALFIILSLSMFGLYELRPPSSLLNKIGNRRSASFAGIYLSGLFVGIFAAPCVGPPVIGLLALVGHYGDPVFGFAAFFVLSLGLGLPYLILGTFAGLMQKLPRSGAWMNWVKKILGFVLIAIACFYLSLAFDPGLVFVLIPLTMILGGFYLGFIEKTTANSKLFAPFKIAFGTSMIVGAVLLYMAGQVSSITWQKYENEAFKAQQQTVLYFGASWCIPCLDLDRRTFTDPEVINRFQNFKRYKIDLSHYDSEESIQMREKFSISGVPTIVFLDQQGNEIRNERIVGFVDAERLLNGINRVEEIVSAGGLSDEQIATESEEEDVDYSTASLISNRTSVMAGESFRIGVLFEMEPGWYTYWRNPGDSGEKAFIDWKLPEGFEISEPYWIAPERFDSGPVTSYGHSDKFLLFYDIKAPENLDQSQKLIFKAEAEWLVCKNICLSQRASLKLEMDAGDKSVSSKHEKYFDKFVARLPQKNDQLSFELNTDSRNIHLDILGVELNMIEHIEFYPVEAGIIRAGLTSYEIDDDIIKISMRRSGLPFESPFKGVLEISTGSEKQFFSVSVESD